MWVWPCQFWFFNLGILPFYNISTFKKNSAISFFSPLYNSGWQAVTLMTADVYVNPRERICSLSVFVSPCLSHLIPMGPSGFPEVSWPVWLVESGSELGTGRGVCSEPSWQSASLTQRHLWIVEEDWLVRGFESQENFPGYYLSSLVLWYLLGMSWFLGTL